MLLAFAVACESESLELGRVGVVVLIEMDGQNWEGEPAAGW